MGGILDHGIQLEGAVKRLFLGVQFGQRTDHLHVVRFRYQPGLIFLDEPGASVLGLLHPLRLFERNGLGLVAENIAVGALAARQCGVAALVHGLARREIFLGLRQVGIEGAAAGQVIQRRLRQGRGFAADLGRQLGKLDHEARILGRIADHDFQRHDGGPGQFQRRGGVHNNAVGEGTVGIRIQHLFGDGHGLGGIAAQGHFGLGDLRRGAGAAHHFFEEPRGGAGGLIYLLLAQGSAAVKKRGLLFQNLAVQGDGVIEIVPLGGLPGLGV